MPATLPSSDGAVAVHLCIHRIHNLTRTTPTATTLHTLNETQGWSNRPTTRRHCLFLARLQPASIGQGRRASLPDWAACATSWTSQVLCKNGMPLADANALMFTMPLFTLILATIWLAERPGMHRWSATCVGFAGALIILRPGMIEVSFAALATLFAAALFSGALIGTKLLTATENPNAMVFYLYTLMIPCAAVGAIFNWTPPEVRHIPLLLALGICTVGAQQFQTRAFRAAPASLVVIVNYVQLPIIALLGWLIFGQSTDIWTWTGAAVICASTYYVSYREGRRKRAT